MAKMKHLSLLWGLIVLAIEVRSERPIRITTVVGSAPFVMDEFGNGTLTGFCVDLVKEMAQGAGGQLKKELKYQGCYEDRNQRMLNVRNPDMPRDNSPQVCGNLCYEKGFNYVGLQNKRECFCGNKMRNYAKKPDRDCDQRCPGNSSQACGGYWRQNIWEWKEVGKFGFNYEFQINPEGSYGSKVELANGSSFWAGMIGDLVNSRKGWHWDGMGWADAAIADLTMTKERMEVVDFTVPFMNTGVSILYSKVGQLANAVYSIEDLLSNPGINFGWVEGGSTHAFLSSSTVPTIRRIWQKANRELMPTNKAGMERVLNGNGNFAFLMEQKSIEYYTGKNCQLTQIGDLLNERNYAIALPKGYTEIAPILANMNNALMTLQQNGKLKALKNKWWGGNGSCDDQTHQNGQNMWGIQIPQKMAQQLRTLLLNIMKPPRDQM